VHNPERAVAEIERVAADKRFVQVLLFAMGDMLLGRRPYWPIYEAAKKHGLAIGIHAGSTYRHAPMASGWPAHRVEDYVAQSAAFESQLLSFLAEGVFQQFPSLRLVLSESGFTWLPSLLWRTSKSWRGMRAEVPWIDRSPAEIIRPATPRRSCAPWNTSVPTACCCSRPTIRTGNSTATPCCRTVCPARRCGGF
jgi:predicted TIM-barrel fold metal-dependent hydrolase